MFRFVARTHVGFSSSISCKAAGQDLLNAWRQTPAVFGAIVNN